MAIGQSHHLMHLMHPSLPEYSIFLTCLLTSIPIKIVLFNLFSTFYTLHRLNGSSSPVLTATCLSYGSLCDFLTFFLNRPGGHTPPPILTQNGSNDVVSHKDVPFGVKIATFLNPWPPNPKNWKLLLDFAFNIGGLRSKHPLFFIGAQWKCHSE